MENFARSAIDDYLGLDECFQWMMRDLGRIGIAFTAIVLHGTPEGLNAAALNAACRANGISSPGRVMGFLNRCYQYGEISTGPGPGHWTRRRLTLGHGFFQHFGRRLRDDMHALAPFAPDLSSAASLGDREDTYLHYVMCSGAMMASRPDLFRASPTRTPYMFGMREAGLLILYDLMLSQPPDRERLLEAAPISRAALSRRFGVSRAHVNKMLSDASDAGLINCPTSDRVVFSPALSAGIERQCAEVFQLTRAAALIALATLPNAPIEARLQSNEAVL